MKTAVIGGGYSGYCAVKALRELAPDMGILVIDRVRTPYDKSRYNDWLAGGDDKDFFLFDKDFIAENKLEVINDEVVRVNFERKRIFFRDAPMQIYDSLIIATGLNHRPPVVSGSTKEGIYLLWNNDPFAFVASLKLYKHIVFSMSTAYGAKCALAAAEGSEKDITILGPAKVIEAVGEKSVRAVKTDDGRFTACDMLILEPDYEYDLKFLKDQPQFIKNGTLDCDEGYGLNGAHDVFVCGSLIHPASAHFEDLHRSRQLRRQTAEKVAQRIAGGGNV